MGGSSSLASAIAGADSKVTVLDDRHDAEDRAAYLWMRSHQLQGYANHRVVIGTELLSPGWIPEKKVFASEHTATSYLNSFVHNHASMHSLQTISRTLISGPAGKNADIEVIAVVAAGLLNGRAWVIELPKRGLKSRFISKTSPAAFAPLNPRFGTKADFAFIALQEGNQWLRGYVPMQKNIVIGKSGMTVASGFDLGQWSDAELAKLAFPQTLMNKISKFASPNRFKGLNKMQVAAKVAKIGPVPELTQTEADLCDGAVFGKILGDAIKAWNANAGAGVPQFANLPGGWQTVWLSRVYQEGSNPSNGDAIAFRNAATSGRWTQAVANLRAYKEYALRAAQEAALLVKEMPPTIGPTVFVK